MDNFPLLDLFIQLRAVGLPIGIGEYRLVLKALQQGIGTADHEALARLCRVLWVKSPDELHIFNYYFEKLVDQERAREPSPSQVSENVEDNNETQRQNSEIIRYIIVGVIFVLGSVTIWWSFSRPRYPVVEPPDQVIVTPDPPPSSSPPVSDPEVPLDPPPPENQPIPVDIVSTELDLTYLWGVLLTGILASGCLLILRGRDKKLTRDDNSLSQLADGYLQPNAASEFVREMEDEVQVAQVLLKDRFSSNTEFLPITRRQMKQSWRYLRHSVREGPPVELDLEATVEQAARQGSLLNPVLVPRYVNRTELLLLIDREGSMITFHSLSQRLAETAAREGRLGNAGIYYFHNCPIQYIYQDPDLLKGELISSVFARLHHTRATVLIVSDAGAARGGFNPERLRLTKNFLDQARLRVRQIAWLNPMPQGRWLETTAQEIARLVPMFEVSRQGLDQAIDVLRGRSHSIDNSG
ncbi:MULTISPECIES: hypothetical protein [unclassified Moorena]|uniref:hypothetical protein n=1 Tax=unclassified Moorena TaxID=2683338 RepID=UPI0013CD7956|nr:MULTISPECIES: hypothetical protein [unclassified Moorena]NEO23609.1 hypothetical protein [Moorena sp. SIO4A5]NEQ57733.1 hypothetical protein [Moorena sp. SIO4A1]